MLLNVRRCGSELGASVAKSQQTGTATISTEILLPILLPIQLASKVVHTMLIISMNVMICSFYLGSIRSKG